MSSVTGSFTSAILRNFFHLDRSGTRDVFSRKGLSQISRRLVLLCLVTIGIQSRAVANVFLAQDEALARAFSNGEEVSEQTIVLSDEQRAEIEALAETKLTSNLFHYYEGRSNGEVSSYAVIDSRIMRSNLAVFMVVLSKDFTVRKVVLLAFNEPQEYMPPEAWLKRLESSAQIGEVFPGQSIPPIAGSTLSANGLSDGVRAVRASFEVVVRSK